MSGAAAHAFQAYVNHGRAFDRQGSASSLTGEEGTLITLKFSNQYCIR